MKIFPYPKTQFYWINILLLMVLIPSCGGDYRSRISHEFTIPESWTPQDASDYASIPGEILETYRVPSEPADGSLILFRSPYYPETSVSQLLIQRKNLLENLPTMNIHDASETQINGKSALLLDLTASGTGSSLSPTGLGKPTSPNGTKMIPTRRIWLTILGGPEEGNLEVFFHCPDSAFTKLKSDWDVFLKSLNV